MFRISIKQAPIPIEVVPDALAQWTLFLAQERLSIHGQWGSGRTSTGGVQYNFGAPDSAHFAIESRADASEWELTDLREIDARAVESVLRDAAARVEHGDFGEEVPYHAMLSTGSTVLDAAFFTHFTRLLGDQVRITGKRRLSDRVLLEFAEEEQADGGGLFAPKTVIDAVLFVPGPVAGPLASRVAAGMTESVAAMCAFSLGRPIDLPVTVFPLEEDRVGTARAARFDKAILGLARDSISVDIFGDLAALGGVDALLRARGAFLAYHAAMLQRSADVATMLFVTSIEALLARRQPWGKEQISQRFIKGTLDLCLDSVDELLAHTNLEMALGFQKRGGERRQRREVLSRIYELRSQPTHTGLGLSPGLAMASLAAPDLMRIALLSDLARGALLAFLQAPRSSLVGHPSFRRDTP